MRTLLNVQDIEIYLENALKQLAKDIKTRQLECSADQAQVLLNKFHILEDDALRLLGPDYNKLLAEGYLPC